MILDYSEYEKRSNSYGLNSLYGSCKDLFFGRKGWCPFCNSEARIVFKYSGVDIERLKDVSFEEVEKVWKCDKCGWWQHSFYSYMESYDEPFEYKDWHEEVNSAILRSFDIDSKEIPIDILREYITKNHEKIYNINDKRDGGISSFCFQRTL